MAALLYVPIALVTLATCLYYYFTRTFNYWKDRGVPGPDPVPIFGNLKESALRRKNTGVVFREMYEAFPDEKIIGVFRMTTPCLLVRDLDIVKHIMIKDFDAFADRGIEFSKDGLGRNLFHADEDTWRVLRNRFTPIFTSGKLKNMLYLMTERGDKFVEYVEELCTKQPEQECHKLVQKFTIATISACAFGLDIDTQSNSEIMKSLKKVDDTVLTLTFANELDMMYPGILKMFNGSLFPAFVKDFFFDLAKDVIKQRNGIPSNRKDFMDLILELRQQGQIYSTARNAEDKHLSLELTDDIIAAQAFVFYVGGYETSATTMAFMLYELAKNPDVQEKIIAEVDEVLEKHNGEITYETVKDMVYLERAFDETLRLYPLVEPLQRKAKVDYKIPGTNVTIKKGTTVLVSGYGIQHDEKYYPDPEKFDPDRHTPQNNSNRHSCAYIPFGIGPRNCIGMRFAKVQSRVCLIKFFSKFRVQPSKNTPVVLKMDPTRLILGPPPGGLPLTITVR